MGIFNRRRASARAEPGSAPAERLSFGPMRMADWRANTSEAICAAAARTANTLASAPLHLYKNEEVQRTHPLERLVRYSPAPGWNAFAFVRDMEFSRSSVGRCYSWVLRDNLRQPTALQYLDAGRVQTLRALETGDLWHRVTLEDGRDGYIHDSDMLALSWLSTSGAITPTSVLRGTLEYDAQIKEFSLASLNGVHDVILINAPSNLSKEKKTAMVTEILETYRATGKSALLLDSGITATQLHSSPVDPKVMDVEKVTKSRVAGVYGMHPHLLGDGESNRVSNEEDMQNFLSLSIVPIMAQWEAECNKKLLSSKMWEEGYAFRFDTSELSRANTQVLAERNFKGVRGGYYRINEIRKREGLPPDPDGDQLLISRDLLPVEWIVAHPEELVSGGRGKTNGAGEDS